MFAILVTGGIFSISPLTAQRASADTEMSKMLQERLGVDDGYALTIHYSGDLQGSLETCG